MIEVKELYKSFDGFQALNGLNMTVPRGAVYGLVGPNGAGKTTFIRHMAGILRPDRGSILVDGESVYENVDLKGRMAYIPDEVFYYTQATTRDMMRFYNSIYPRFSEECYEKLGEVLKIDDRRPMRKLSKGMQKQAAFRLAISCCPDIIVLDEPVDGLDPVMRRNVWSIMLSEVAERGMSVIVSSHNLRELEDVCDRVGIMDKGKMLLERSLSELQDNIAKVQLVLPDGVSLPADMKLLNSSSTGRLRQLIIKGSAGEVEESLSALNPVYCETVPMTLEEIFIYELGGEGYEVRNVII